MLNREPKVDDILAMLARRKWWIVVPAIILPIVLYTVSIFIPAQYTSQTLVLVEQPKVPDKFVTSVVTDQLAVRLATMQEQILSRTRLQPLIERFGLYREDVGKVPIEDLIDRLRSDIKVTTLRGGPAGVPGFYISFSANNPRLAQQVCAEITSMFMEENLKVREQRAQGTTDFLTNQLDDAKRKLDEQESKLADFQQKYMGQLPDQMQSNMTMLSTLNGQQDAVTQALGRAQQDKTYLESLLEQQSQTWKASLNSSANPRDLQQQLDGLQDELRKLQVRYTDDHPDVIKVKQQIARVRKQLDTIESTPATTKVNASAVEPKELQQLRLQVQIIKDSIAQKTKQQEKIQSDIKNYQARLQMTPKVEEEYKSLTRDHETALNFYNSLLAKRTESEMATDLERKQQGEQFRIMDPANLPERPTFPNRMLFGLAGFVVGVGLGLGLAFLSEFRDKSLRTEHDIQVYLQIPVLAMVPVVGHAALMRNNERPRWKFWSREKKKASVAGELERAVGA